MKVTRYTFLLDNFVTRGGAFTGLYFVCKLDRKKIRLIKANFYGLFFCLI